MLTGIMLVLALLSAHQAEEDLTQFSYERAQDFARCAAVFDSVALLLEHTDQPANAEEHRNLGNGAEITARYFAQSGGVHPDRLQQFYQSIYDAEFTRQLAFAERGELDEAQYAACVELQPIQVEVIRIVRQLAYSQPDK